MSHHFVTGVPREGAPITDPAPPRLNIFDLVKNKKMFDIYVQAIAQMQVENQTDSLSYFSLAAIHGLPVQRWEGAAPPSGSWYCHHGVNTFPTWHRPYCGLFEQVLNSNARAIANTYTTRDKVDYVRAAQDLRAPYWDWAAQAVPPAEVISQKTLSIVQHDGTTKTVTNPLFQYTFHPLFANPPSVARNRPFTVRCPRPGENVTNVQDLIDSLQGNGETQKLDWRSASYDMLTRTTTWDTMANGVSKHGNTGPRDAVNSLEVIHGDVHVVVGGGGHMAVVPVAAFDPIFWMHHMNVDRMLALWQAIHPTTFLDAADAKKDLLPFWNNATTFWNSNEAKGTEVLNYTYPEFVKLHGASPNAIKSAITDQINRLYGPSEDDFSFAASMSAQPVEAPPQNLMTAGGAQAVRVTRQAVEGVQAAGAHAAGAVGLSSAQAALAPSHPQQHSESQPQAHAQQHPEAHPQGYVQPQAVYHPEGETHQYPVHHSALPRERIDWTVRIRTRLHQFGQSFTILIFVGDPPADQSEWRISPHFVGAFAPFVNESPDECANCREHAEVIVEGFVNISKYLHRLGHLGHLQPQQVVHYLKNKIHWRIQIIDTRIVEAEEVEDLEVAVMSIPLRWSEEEKSYQMTGRPTHHPEITTGRAGGRNTA